MKFFSGIIATVLCLVASVATLDAAPRAEKLSDVLSSHSVPSADFLKGQWNYIENSFVFYKDSGVTPTTEMVDRNLALMTIRPEDFELIFLDEGSVTFRIGKKKCTLKWKLNAQTREFSASLAFFSVKGYLVQDGERIMLIYSKSDLEMMMKFLCPISTHKYIRELMDELEKTPGLTIAFSFSKNNL